MSEKKTSPIPGFTLQKKLGQGGMGAVYRAVQDSMGREIALKVLPISSAKDPVFLERFFREARAAGRLNHPNIVQGIDAGQTDKYCWIAMELVEGGSIADAISRQGAYTESDALRLVTDIARALVHAHQNGIVHRDIKPENFLLDERGAAKLCDLGIAKAPTDPSLTMEGRALGTPRYIAPEQAQGLDTVDGRADIYSLGISWYHMLTGEAPFDGPTAAAIMMKHIREPLPHLSAKVPGISTQTVLVLEKMVAKEPDKRYPNATALLEDLDCIASGKPPRHAAKGFAKTGGHRSSPARTHANAPRSNTKSKASPMPLYAAAGGGVLILVIIMVAVMGRDQSTGGMPPPPATPPAPQVSHPKSNPDKPIASVRAAEKESPKHTAPKPADTEPLTKYGNLILPKLEAEPIDAAPPVTGKVTEAQQKAASKILAGYHDEPDMADWKKSLTLEELIKRYPGTDAAVEAATILKAINEKMAEAAMRSNRAAAKTAFSGLRQTYELDRRMDPADGEILRKNLLAEYDEFIATYPGTDEALKVQAMKEEVAAKRFSGDADSRYTGRYGRDKAPEGNIPEDAPLPALRAIMSDRLLVKPSSIKPFLKHSDDEIRRFALQSLYRIGPKPEALAAARGMLADSVPMNRMLAIEIISRERDYDAAQALKKIADSDPDPHVRKIAASAYASL